MINIHDRVDVCGIMWFDKPIVLRKRPCDCETIVFFAVCGAIFLSVISSKLAS